MIALIISMLLKIAIVLCGIGCIGIGVIFFKDSENKFVKILTSSIAIIVGVIFILSSLA